jgi:hypothetical protein
VLADDRRDLLEVAFVGEENLHADEVGEARSRLLQRALDVAEGILALHRHVGRILLGVGIEAGRAGHEHEAARHRGARVADLLLVRVAGKDALSDHAGPHFDAAKCASASMSASEAPAMAALIAVSAPGRGASR